MDTGTIRSQHQFRVLTKLYFARTIHSYGSAFGWKDNDPGVALQEVKKEQQKAATDIG